MHDSFFEELTKISAGLDLKGLPKRMAGAVLKTPARAGAVAGSATLSYKLLKNRSTEKREQAHDIQNRVPEEDQKRARKLRRAARAFPLATSVAGAAGGAAAVSHLKNKGESLGTAAVEKGLNYVLDAYDRTRPKVRQAVENMAHDVTDAKLTGAGRGVKSAVKKLFKFRRK